MTIRNMTAAATAAHRVAHILEDEKNYLLTLSEERRVELRDKKIIYTDGYIVRNHFKLCEAMIEDGWYALIAEIDVQPGDCAEENMYLGTIALMEEHARMNASRIDSKVVGRKPTATGYVELHADGTETYCNFI